MKIGLAASNLFNLRISAVKKHCFIWFAFIYILYVCVQCEWRRRTKAEIKRMENVTTFCCLFRFVKLKNGNKIAHTRKWEQENGFTLTTNCGHLGTSFYGEKKQAKSDIELAAAAALERQRETAGVVMQEVYVCENVCKKGVKITKQNLMGETSEQEKWNEMANKKVRVLSLFHFTLLCFNRIVSLGRSLCSVSSLSASVRASNLLARLMSFWYEVEIGNARNVGGKSARFNSNALCFQHLFSGSADEAI